MRIYIGSDHRGFNLKEEIKKYFYETGVEYEDLGAYELDPLDDYPIYAERVSHKVSEEIKNANESRGILLCGSGVGVDIVANKFEHIRSGLGINAEQIRSARRDDNINVLAIAADETDEKLTREMVKAFIETEFETSEKHTRRLNEIEEIENES